MKTRTYLILFLYVLHFIMPAQKMSQDKILKGISSPVNDSNKVYALIEYGYIQEINNLDSAAKYYKAAADLSEKIGFAHGQLKAIANWTYILNQNGFLDSGLVLNLKALSISKKINNQLDIANSLSNLGSSYTNLNKNEQAIDYYLQAIKIFEVINSKKGLMVTYGNIGGVLGNTEKDSKALQYYSKSIQLARELKDSSYLCSTLINMGISLKFLNLYKQSENYLQEGLAISKLINNTYLQSQAILSLAELFAKQDQYEKSILYSKNGLDIAVRIDSKYGQMEALKIISRVYSRMGNADSAIKYFNAAIIFGKKHNFNATLYKLYEILSYNYYVKKNYKMAYDILDTAGLLKDSLKKEEVSKKIEQLEISFKSAQNEKYILNLEKEKQQQNILIISLSSIIIVTLFLSFFIYKNVQNQKKLAEQKNISKDNEFKQLQKEQQLNAANLIMQGQEEERTRFARDLHDGLGGLLSGIKFSVTNNSQLPSEEKNKNILSQLDNAIVEMRRIAHSMMPEVLVQFGLNEALKDFCDNLSLTGKTTIHLQCYGLEPRLPQSIEVVVFRIIQELLNNAIKHAYANDVYVQLLKNDNELTLTVEDNGKGFNTGDLEKLKGAGFKNILSRVDYLNGKLDIESTRNVGTSINIEFKL